MRIPLPCKFGETFEYKGKSLKLLSVSWFKWSYKGLEFTYTTDKEFVTSTDMNQPEYMEIPDEMVKSFQNSEPVEIEFLRSSYIFHFHHTRREYAPNICSQQ